MNTNPQQSTHVLVVANEGRGFREARSLAAAGFVTEVLADPSHLSVERRRGSADVVVTDGEDARKALDVLEAVRRCGRPVPAIVSGCTRAATVAKLMTHGALHCLPAAAPPERLCSAVNDAAHSPRRSPAVRRVAGRSRGGLEGRFDATLESLWLAHQPIVSMSDRNTVGFEALLRNEDVMLGMPLFFFDVAEYLGRTFDASRRIRRLAAAELALFPEITLFLNISPLDLADERLYDAGSELTRYSNRVVLEITERASLQDLGEARRRADRLRDLGYRLAVDDLGSGYAGLTSITALEPEFVKIDMELVRRIDRERTARRLVGAIYDFASCSGMQVIAEGVETPEERDALMGLGADLVQGYLFARPAKGFPELADSAWTPAGGGVEARSDCVHFAPAAMGSELLLAGGRS